MADRHARVERMARALCIADGRDPDAADRAAPPLVAAEDLALKPSTTQSRSSWESYLAQASKVVDALDALAD